MKILEKTLKLFKLMNSILFADSSIEGDIVHCESGKIDPIRQDILRHLETHLLGVKLIKDSIIVLDEDDEFKDHRRELFQVCFCFLKNFVLNNSANQMYYKNCEFRLFN